MMQYLTARFAWEYRQGGGTPARCPSCGTESFARERKLVTTSVVLPPTGEPALPAGMDLDTALYRLSQVGWRFETKFDEPEGGAVLLFSKELEP